MGQKKSRKEKFLKEHPTCCFCGDHASETQDHIPSRDFFFERSWPEGYVFPACCSCNNNSAILENTVAFYQNAMNFNDSQYSADETEQRISALLNNLPVAFPRAVQSSVKRKKILNKMGIQMSSGQTTEDYPVIAIDSCVQIAFHVFSSKLLCALYYKHMQEVVPTDSLFFCCWDQYMSQNGQKIARNSALGMEASATLSRGGKSLHDQFKYNYNVDIQSKSFAFVAQFCKSFFVSGSVSRFDACPQKPWQNCKDLPFR